MTVAGHSRCAVCCPEDVGLDKRLPLETALRMTLQGRNYRPFRTTRGEQLARFGQLIHPPEVARATMNSSGLLASSEE